MNKTLHDINKKIYVIFIKRTNQAHDKSFFTKSQNDNSKQKIIFIENHSTRNRKNRPPTFRTGWMLFT